MKHGFALILLALIITGCAANPTLAPLTAELQQKFAERDRSLASLTRWSFTGRIAVQANNDGWSGTMQWMQNDQNYVIDIRGPAGTGTVRLERSEQGNVLRLSDEQSFAGHDVRALLIEHIGWDIPVDALQRWIIGRPDPGFDKQFELDDAGRLLHLRQSGWDVEYKRYSRTGMFDLPEKIFARNEHAQLRLFVDEWSTQ
ncbi:MAG: outer membrane lipoprotein LolB [Gammaproteobacteria bacterium]|nr:outer membrane lipoprotein LolB [Gammaproteobacteria bacterium]